MRLTSTISSYASALLLFSGGSVDAHSWVEELKRIAPGGSLLEPAGFSRNYVPRTGGDPNQNMMKIVGSTSGQPLCNPTTSKTAAGAYSNAKYPKLKAARDDFIALRYLENGHVTKWADSPPKPKNQGTVYIYATTKPKANEMFENVHRKWTSNGTDATGDNQTGWLLATRNYDDGRCFENGNPNADQRKNQFGIADKASTDGQGMNHWCQNDIQLPGNIKPGQDLTLYWVWDYSTISKRQGAPDNEHLGSVKVETNEFYISCMEIGIVDDCSKELGDVKGPQCQSNKAAAAPGAGTRALASSGSYAFNFDKSQDLKLAAIPGQLTGPRFAVPLAAGGGNGGGNTPPAETTPASSRPAATTTSASKPSNTNTSHIKYITVTKGMTTVFVTASAVKTETVTQPAAQKPAITTPAQSSVKTTTTTETIIRTVSASLRPRGQGWYGDAR